MTKTGQQIVYKFPKDADLNEFNESIYFSC